MKNCLPVPPPLKINKVLYKDREMPLHVRVEQRIVWNLMLALKAAEFLPDNVDSGDEQIKTRSYKAAMEELFNLDDAYFVVRKSGEKHWIRLVFGNGIDVISDYSGIVGEFTKLMDGFKPEEFA